MAKSDEYAELKEFLQERGHTADEIDKIMRRVQQYEREVQTDSLMDSIAGGTFNLEQLIEEALTD